MATVYDLQEGVMQERFLHIKLMNRLGARDGQGKHSANHGRLDHHAKCLIIVDVRSLSEAAKDPVRLVSFQRAIGVELVIENPFASDDVGANGARYKILGVVGDQGSQPLFWARLERLDMRSYRQLRLAVESPVEHGAPVVVQAWEPQRESHHAEKCLNR
jgi:hypothetical protein